MHHRTGCGSVSLELYFVRIAGAPIWLGRAKRLSTVLQHVGFMLYD